MKRYNPSEIEPKWQKIWADSGRYATTEDASKQKYYISCMFPYPSGAGMHTGHAFEHAIVDAVARFQRSLGKNVMNPMGWDAFGLPAENYAIKTGTAPSEVTKVNIANFTNQLTRMGVSLDWSREVNTSDPSYYKWTQWIFKQFFLRNLAYQKKANQWWCPTDKTVLANEQVVDGKCWRCETVVEKRAMKQWFFKITDYADALLEELPNLDWPNKIKVAQENWIGRSEGAEIVFITDESQAEIKVFTTRPDTLFGASFLVLAPEHPLIESLVNDDTRQAVDSYVKESIKRSEIERMAENKDKTGVFTGGYAINPGTGEKIPIWVADYVLWGYGTGAIMAVPAHDERDFAFAEKFELPIIKVIDTPDETHDICYHGEGELVNSGVFNGTRSEDAREQIVAWLEEQGRGKIQVSYKMRDWLISRQRYWGAPIPIVHTADNGSIALADSELPLKLPFVKNYAPTGEGSALANERDWVEVWVNIETGETKPRSEDKPNGDKWVAGERETDTMDGYACSSWYLLRYTDPRNDKQAWSREKADYWLPVDMYVGGDHAVAHLLYVRFWNHVFYDMELVSTKEPVKKLVYHGLIQAEDGRKMSKSLGNVVDPLEVIDAGYGADALRIFELFLGPIDENSNWSSRGIAGVYRFLNRVYTLTNEFIEADKPTGDPKSELISLQHKTIKKVTDDIRRLNFNTAIASLMEFVNELYKLKLDGFSEAWREPIESLVQMISPFAPHLAAELWQDLGKGDQLDIEPWPVWDDKLIQTTEMTIVVQVNGKVRAKLVVSADTSEDEIKALALADTNVQAHLQNKQPTKVIYIHGRLVSVVI